MFYKKISDNLTRWGKKSQKISPNNDAIKQNVLNSLRPTLEETKIKHSFAWRWLMVATVPALAILFMVTYNNNLKEGSVAYIYENQLDTELTIDSSKGGDGFGLEMAASNVGLAQEETSLIKRIADKISMPEPEPMIEQPSIYYYNENPNITDTREYLKTAFSLNIKTRKVEKIHTRLKTIIRGYDGRIDRVSLKEKYSSISFVLPKSTYESFIEEVTEMFPEKFITINESSANLLGQKQNIERQTENTSSTLENLKIERNDSIQKYDEIIASLNKEISRLDNSMYALVAQKKTVSSTDTETLKKINDQINYLSRIRSDHTHELIRTMTQHEKDLANFDNQIKNTENNLIELGEQETKLINNVETVNGTITLHFVSLFEIANLYIPVYKTIIIICVLIIIGYFLFGRKQKEIELP